jgi:dihydrofolate synthase/folylpolyglutamate synthase
MLARTFAKEFSREKGILILGVSRDKNLEGICKELKTIAKKVVFTKASHPRAMCFSGGEGKKLFPGKECFYKENIFDALLYAEELAGAQDIICITGSIFLIAEARKIIKDKGEGG